MFLTPEQLSNFPVEHLSPSAIRSALSNPQEFFMRYVRYIFDAKKSPAMVEGDCVHQVIEGFWNTREKQPPTHKLLHNWEASAIDIIEDVLVPAEDEIDFGKTGSMDKSKDTILQAIAFYKNELPEYWRHEIIAVEQKMLSDFEDLEGNPMPVPIKGYIDLAVRFDKDDDALDIIDHKVVGSHTEIDKKGNPVKQDDVAKYELQAAPYFFLFRKHFGRNPRRMVFDELKKTKNKDGGAQLQHVVIEFTPKLLNRWLEVYRRVCKMLAGIPLIDRETGVIQFLPNPFAQFGGGESWADFCEEVDEGKVWTFDALKEIRSSKFKRAEEVDAAF